MVTYIDKHHDEEIQGLSFNRDDKKLIIKTNKSSLILNGVEYFDFSPFEIQNVIFEINMFEISEIPLNYKEEYLWIDNYASVSGMKLLYIDSSVGLYGMIIFSSCTSVALVP